jgi:hypothetical protein
MYLFVLGALLALVSEEDEVHSRLLIQQIEEGLYSCKLPSRCIYSSLVTAQHIYARAHTYRHSKTQKLTSSRFCREMHARRSSDLEQLLHAQARAGAGARAGAEFLALFLPVYASIGGMWNQHSVQFLLLFFYSSMMQS